MNLFRLCFFVFLFGLLPHPSADKSQIKLNGQDGVPDGRVGLSYACYHACARDLGLILNSTLRTSYNPDLSIFSVRGSVQAHQTSECGSGCWRVAVGEEKKPVGDEPTVVLNELAGIGLTIFAMWPVIKKGNSNGQTVT